ncbi:TPM domain-containing protein [Acidovorax radicis]|uniref:TPM domain-containing protein n=1 Tax=Acidovorax radicis TaxID=758826 RepID=UPI001CFA7F27|nr:TPM domain-containing protein [Acidovorax radicis]UCU99600.1 TPM domain-containing protein [Acidovorax radicis]
MPLVLIRHALTAILFIAMALPWTVARGAVQAVPTLTAHVMDQTGTLNAPDTQALESQLRTLEQTHGSQVVVLMVQTTAPEDIAAYANRVANQWKIGRADVGDGVLVVVAKADRKMRIEVAKSLEGAIPDIAAAQIIDTAMKPRFQQNDYAGGLSAAATQLSARIAGEALPPPTPTSSERGRDRSHGNGFDWTDLAIFLFFGVMVAGPLVRRLFGAGLGGLLMGGGVGVLAFLLTSSLLLSGGAGVLALLYTWFFGGRMGPVLHGGGDLGGGWGGGGGSSGGGFSSGGGGNFGGGGASGDW